MKKNLFSLVCILIYAWVKKAIIFTVFGSQNLSMTVNVNK